MTIIQSKVGKRAEDTVGGVLQLEGATPGSWETFSCQPTSCAITPTSNEGSAGDTIYVLCGDPLTGDSKDDQREATLEITAIQDFTNPAGLQAYSWKYDSVTPDRKFRWQATGDPLDLWEGTVKVRAIGVGGTVGERLDQSFSWKITALRLPPRFGANLPPWLGSGLTRAVSAASKGAVEPGFEFAADPAVTTVANLGTAGFVVKDTAGWVPGSSFHVGTVEAHWDGAAWAAGTA